MTTRPLRCLIMTVLVLLPLHLCLASGNGGSSSGGGGVYGTAPKVIDHTYERGRAVFTGRVRKYGKIKLCVETEAGKTTVKRKHLKPYRNGKSSQLRTALYDCRHNEAQLLALVVSSSDLNALTHYLNKRFNLRLRD